MNWVLRTAANSGICANCDDHIRPGRPFFLMVTGECYCQDCPPEEAEGCQL